jgi:Histidine kinase
MLVSRRADTDHKDAVSYTFVAVRRSLRAIRRFLLVAAIAFVAVPLAMLAELDGTPFQFLPLALAIGGLIWVRFESLSLERDLRRARVRALDAVDFERERIKRDLHDGAQQRLVSVRIHMGLLAQSAETVDERATIEELGRDLDAALVDIRNVTRDGSPDLLARKGVSGSLESVAAHAALPVTVETRSFGRYSPRLERGIYYACLEALQARRAERGRPHPPGRGAGPDRVLDRGFRCRIRSRTGRDRPRPYQPRRPGGRDGRHPDDRHLSRDGHPHPRRSARGAERGALKARPTSFPPLPRAPTPVPGWGPASTSGRVGRTARPPAQLRASGLAVAMTAPGARRW